MNALTRTQSEVQRHAFSELTKAETIAPAARS